MAHILEAGSHEVGGASGDALSRLRAADLGELVTGVPDPYINPQSGVPTRYHTWMPDLLGNWVGNPNNSGFQRAIDQDGDGEMDTWADIWHATDPANEIRSIRTDIEGEPGLPKPVVYDRAGNLVWDSAYLYLYDGFNRLIQINKGDLLGVDSFESNGSGRLKKNISPGVTVAKFTYDGLGRLIRSWRQNANQTAGEEVHWYYDGVRRIQEVETTTGGTSPGTVTREYVWGPGYADEIVCQLDYSADPLGGTGVTPETYYYLQDANYNVVAVVSPGSVSVPPAVVWQYAYEPYGRMVTAEALPPPGAPPGWAPPVNRVGFQGLFLEPVLFNASNPGLSASSMSLWCARNRFILSSIGRFLTRDPAEAAMPIITALAFNGDTLDAFLTGFSPTGHYGDGFNLYEFVGSNPVRRNDPLGLQWGFDDDIDEIVGNICGERAAAAAAAAAQIGMGLNVAAIIGHMAFSMLPGADAVGLGVKLAMGKNVTWEDIGAAALSVGGAAIVVKYGAKFARATAGYIRKLGQRAIAWLRGGARVGQVLQVDDVIRYVKSSGGCAPPGYMGGRVFENREGVLPTRPTGYYREYDVHPYDPRINRGQERLVIGQDGEVWYTLDHYQTFSRIE